MAKVDSTRLILLKFLNFIFWRNEKLPLKFILTRYVAINKSSFSNSPSDTRGLRLKSIFYTIALKMLKNRVKYVIDFNLEIEQGGYRLQRGVDHQIIAFRNIITAAKYQNKPLFVITLDLSKAFDRMWIARMLLQLWKINIRGKLWRIFKNIYHHSKAFLHFKEFSSAIIDITCGSGQGFSISGPFFDLFINDLILELNSLGIKPKSWEITLICLLYSDDILLVANNSLSIKRLLIQCVKFMKKVGLKINFKKCTYSIFHKSYLKSKTEARSGINFKVSNIKVKIDLQHQFKYLGIMFSTSCSWLNEQKYITKKCKNNIHFLLANDILGNEMNLETQKQVYITTIRPFLEFPSRMISFNKSNMAEIEKVQNYALRKASFSPAGTKMAIIRVILGVPRLEARFDMMLLRCFHDISCFQESVEYSTSYAFLTTSKMFEHVNDDTMKFFFDNKFSNPYIRDIISVIYKHQNEFSKCKEYDLDDPSFESIRKISKNKWHNILNKIIIGNSFKQDIKEIDEFKYNYVIKNIIKTLKLKRYKPIVNELLDIKKMECVTKFHKFFIRFVTNSLSFCWKRSKSNELIIKNCIICKKRWEQPTRHLLISCNELKHLYKNFSFGGREFGDFDLDKFRNFLKSLYEVFKNRNLLRFM